MTSDHRQQEAITSYRDAPSRTVTTAGVIYAYRELGPKGGIPVRRIAGSTLTIYPNSGHGGIFQFHDQFASTAIEFLDR